MPSTSPGASANETPSFPANFRPSSSSAATPLSGLRALVSATSSATAAAAARAAASPSMCATIASSPPSCGTIVATAPPSRRIVARSHVWITSLSRCVMNSTERPRSRWARITANTRSARSDGRAAVISSSISSFGSRASARARSIMRSSGSGTSPTNSPKSTSSSIASSSCRTALGSVPVRRRLAEMVRSGTSAGSWNTGARPMRAALAGERRRTSFPSTSTVPRSAWITPVRIFTSVLFPLRSRRAVHAPHPARRRGPPTAAQPRGHSSWPGHGLASGVRPSSSVRRRVGRGAYAVGKMRGGPEAAPHVQSLPTAPCRPSAERSSTSSRA